MTLVSPDLALFDFDAYANSCAALTHRASSGMVCSAYTLTPLMVHHLIERWWSAQGRSSQEGREGSCRITTGYE